MIAVWLIVYVLSLFCLLMPFRISSAESRREEREIRKEGKYGIP